MKKLRFNSKLLVLLLIPVAGLILFSSVTILEKYHSSVSLNVLNEKIILCAKIGDVTHEFQKERGATGVFVGSQGKLMANELNAQIDLSNQKIDDLLAYLPSINQADLSNEMSKGLDQILSALKVVDQRRSENISLSVTSDEATAYYTEMNTNLLGVINSIALASNDKKITRTIATYLNFLQYKEGNGIERALLSFVFAEDAFPKGVFIKLSNSVAQQRSYLKMFKLYATSDEKEFYFNTIKIDAFTETAAMREVAIEKFIEGGFDVNPKYWFERMTTKINALKIVEDKISENLLNNSAQTRKQANATLKYYLFLTIALLIVAGIVAYLIIKSIKRQLGGEPNDVAYVANQMVKGQLDLSIEKLDIENQSGLYGSILKSYHNFKRKTDELGEKTLLLNSRLKEGESLAKEIEKQNWLKTRSAKIYEISKGISKLDSLCEVVLQEIANELGAGVGALYVNQIFLDLSAEVQLIMEASYAFKKTKKGQDFITLGEGIVGQCALERKPILINHPPEDYIEVTSGLGKSKPKQIFVFPVLHNDKVIAVFEFGLLAPLDDLQKKYLDDLRNNLGIVLNGVIEQGKAQELALEVANQITAINRSNAAVEFDLKGNVLWANDLFLDLIGYSFDEIIGVNHSNFTLEEYRKSEEYIDFWKKLRSGSFTSGEFQRQTKDGRNIWIQGSYNPINDKDGKPFKVLKIAVDITEQKQQQQDIILTNEKLQSQEEELRVFNSELKFQTKKLQASEEELKTQQEELAQSNAELEEKSQLLEEQNVSINDKNEALIIASEALDIKAQELASSSKYKSEFLSNMSHELRTPLNSVLILSKLLTENKNNNLTEKQIEFASVIHKSGNDLLTLINEVLDLAKVESGKVELELDSYSVKSIAKDVELTFNALAFEKKVTFNIEVDDTIPENITTDKLRIEQILKNLLSNAFKFTSKNGSVTMAIKSIPTIAAFTQAQLMKSKNVLEISVTDTGIGIKKEKLESVFAAFQQADGSTQRKYGGTGLGLSISRELAGLLGGEIHLKSEEGKGSTFTLYLPFESKENTDLTVGEVDSKAETIVEKTSVTAEASIDSSELNLRDQTFESVIADDRDNFIDDDRRVLIVEDDLHFAKILLDFARDKGYKGVVIDQGDLALKYVEAYEPQAILLDMQLPVMNGLTVLKKLKASNYAHIPVHMMSGTNKKKLGLELGAVDYLLKPISSDQLESVFESISSVLSNNAKNVLIIEDNKAQNMAVKELVSRKGLDISSAYNGKDAIDYITNNTVDLVILDLGLPDIKGTDLLEQIKALKSSLPVIVFTGKDLSKKELSQINKFKETSVVVKTGTSHTRLLEETDLFLHHISNVNLSDSPVSKIKRAANENIGSLEGRKVLLVDDDMRNIYALQTILEAEGIETIIATDGLEALEAVKGNEDIEIVLMDIMMPEMDGYEATKQIRAMGKTNLPIIALTAKAMKGDREKCLEAGLSDYMSKPIDTDKLLSLMRVWLYN